MSDWVWAKMESSTEICNNVASEGFKGSQAPLGSKIYKRKPKSTTTPTKVLDFEEPAERPVNTGSTPSAQVNNCMLAQVNTRQKWSKYRMKKNPMNYEDHQAEGFQASKKSKSKSFKLADGVLSIFDREDLKAVYELVMEKYQDEIPEGIDKMLWGDLKQKKKHYGFGADQFVKLKLEEFEDTDDET
ncbi:hypothetical protein Tco_0168534 [Tanacetum coccineum]